MAAGEDVSVSSQTDIEKAAIASESSFVIGGILPTLVTLFFPIQGMVYILYGFTLIFLVILGIISAKTGGSSMKNAIIRITIWGTLAMGLTALVGHGFGVNV